MFGQKSSSSRSHCWSCPGMVPAMSCKRGYCNDDMVLHLIINNTNTTMEVVRGGTRRRVSQRSPEAVHDSAKTRPHVCIRLRVTHVVSRLRDNDAITMGCYHVSFWREERWRRRRLIVSDTTTPRQLQLINNRYAQSGTDN